MPSWELFNDQPQAYHDHPECREHVLPVGVTARGSVEQASALGRAQCVGRTGHTIGMKTFGAAAPLKV